MPDRIDIDALLIGALYGELTPADEALLTAHLESHPVDRTALSDLTRTRAVIRDSRALALQLEPPQGVSALLLREASRRAPRSQARDRENAGWFHRFTRTFMAHPAMAAAAVVVLVAGVAGTLYFRGVDQFAETAPPPLPHDAVPSTTESRSVAQTPAVGNAETASDPARVEAGSAGAGAPAQAPSGDGRLDGAKDQPAPAGELASKGERTAGDADDRAQAAPQGGKPAAIAPAPRRPDDKPVTSAKPRSRDRKASGVEVGGREPSPRELGDDAEPPARPLVAPSDRDTASPPARVTRGAVTGATRRGASAAASAPPPNSALDQGAAAAPEPRAPAQAAPAPEAALDTPKPAGAPVAKAPPPPPPGAQNTPAFRGKAADRKETVDAEKAARDKLLEWARKQHGQVIALVGANNCRAAASAAVEIYSRAPDYYAANVVTDRSIKPCLAYLNNEREREERSRAAAKMSDPAAPPVSK